MRLLYLLETVVCVGKRFSCRRSDTEVNYGVSQIKHNRIHPWDEGGSRLREMNIYWQVALLTQNELTRGSQWSLLRLCVCVGVWGLIDIVSCLTEHWDYWRDTQTDGQRNSKKCKKKKKKQTVNVKIYAKIYTQSLGSLATCLIC